MLIPRNINAEITKILKIEEISKRRKIEEKVSPVVIEYKMNKSIAVVDFIFLIPKVHFHLWQMRSR